MIDTDYNMAPPDHSAKEAFETPFGVRFDEFRKHIDYRLNQTDKKLDEVIGKHPTKEDLERINERLNKIESSFGWFWKLIATLLVGGLFAYFGINPAGIQIHH